jgi:hypothetical protein
MLEQPKIFSLIKLTSVKQSTQVSSATQCQHLSAQYLLHLPPDLKLPELRIQ